MRIRLRQVLPLLLSLTAIADCWTTRSASPRTRKPRSFLFGLISEVVNSSCINPSSYRLIGGSLSFGGRRVSPAKMCTLPTGQHDFLLRPTAYPRPYPPSFTVSNDSSRWCMAEATPALHGTFAPRDLNALCSHLYIRAGLGRRVILDWLVAHVLARQGISTISSRSKGQHRGRYQRTPSTSNVRSL